MYVYISIIIYIYKYRIKFLTDHPLGIQHIITITNSSDIRSGNAWELHHFIMNGEQHNHVCLVHIKSAHVYWCLRTAQCQAHHGECHDRP